MASQSLAPSLNDSGELLERYRHMAHKELDKLIDKLAPLLLSQKPLTLMEISEAFQSERLEFLGALFSDFIKVHHQELVEQEFCDCPQCGKLLKKRRRTRRQIETTQGGSTLERPYFYCPDCSFGFCPLDQVLELAQRKKQYDLQQKALKILAEMPFERASELFEELTGVSFSDHSLHELFETFSHESTIEDVIPSREEIQRRIDKLSASKAWRPVLVVAGDGAMVPTRAQAKRDEKRGPGEYREAKGFRLYLLGEERLEHIASWHQIQDAEQFGRDLKLVAQRVPTEKVRIGLIGDGASWLWRYMTEAFPDGREILDYYHCSEHIHALAQSQYADDPYRALQWVESTMSRLFFGGVGHVIGGLRRMEPRNQDVKEQIRKLIGYLNNNKHKIHYRGDRIGGYPIGSGGIESANKFICHTRLKRSGAWWLKVNGNAMLRLRCSIFNGTFEQTFAKYVTQEQAKRLLTNA